MTLWALRPGGAGTWTVANHNKRNTPGAPHELTEKAAAAEPAGYPGGRGLILTPMPVGGVPDLPFWPHAMAPGASAIPARLFRLGHRFRGDLRDRRGNPQPIGRRPLIEQSVPLRKKLFALAEAHLDDAEPEVRNLAPAAERILGTAVQRRKISFGNRRRNGEIATARFLTATQTCKRQQCHVPGYLTDAVRCHRRRAPARSLLPQRACPPELLH